MHWYLTVTHISDCEIISVTLITMPLICKCYKNGLCNITETSSYCQLNYNKQLSCFKYFKALQLDIMAHNSFANSSLPSHIAHDYSP